MGAPSKLNETQSYISGTTVAHMILDFQREFRGVYGLDTMASSLCAVGPLQAMIGLAIKLDRLRALKEADDTH